MREKEVMVLPVFASMVRGRGLQYSMAEVTQLSVVHCPLIRSGKVLKVVR